MPYLRNTLLVLSSDEDGPSNATGVLALKEEGLGLSVLESEDLAITTDVELALYNDLSALHAPLILMPVISVVVTDSSANRHHLVAKDIRTFPG